MTKARFSDTYRNFDLLADLFLRERVEHVFALLGDANMYWATRMADRGCGFTYVRHEHAAVAAALSYARLSGNVGVASVTCGPGLTNVLTALPAAVLARVPLIVFAGEAPMGSAWYNQLIEQAPFVTACGAAYHRVHDPARIPQIVRDAFIQAAIERRPVVLGVPLDLQDLAANQDAEMPTSAVEVLARRRPSVASPAAIAEIADEVASANRIVILGGLGACSSEAVTAARQLAGRCDALLATTLPARGLYNDDRYSVGVSGGLASPTASELLAEADLVIAVGASLAHHTSMGGKTWPKAKTIQIDSDPQLLNQGRLVADLFVQGEAALTLDALNAVVAPKPTIWRTPELARRLRDTPPFVDTFGQADDGAFDPRDVVMALDRVLPESWTIINTSGHVSGFTSQMQWRPFGRFLTIREFGAIGNGTSFALGAAIARSSEPIVLLDGDGSLLMHIQELETIARHRLPVMVVVLNDGAFGSEIHKLRAKGFSDAGAVFGSPDFSQVAGGFGFESARVDELLQFNCVVEEFAERRRPYLIDVPIRQDVISGQMKRLAAKH